jgi:hypothetical protein
VADGKFVYEVVIDAATAQAAARKLRAVFEQELAQAQAAPQSTQAQTQANRAAAQAATEFVRQQTAAVRGEQTRQTAIVRAESAERAAAARQEAQMTGEAARMARALVEGEQKRLTASYTAEIRKREREERAAAQTAARSQASPLRNVGGALRGIDSFLALGMGGLAGYGAIQAGQAFYSAGREGAEMERTAQLYEIVTARMGVSAAKLLETMQAASRGVLTEAQAQSQGLQILSQKWAGTRTDIVADAGILTAASRKFAMIYPDSEGRPQSSNEVAAKLLSYIREGNKELVDQFNINNAAIAQAAGVPNENLTSEDRARGLFKILAEEIERIPDTMGTSIEKIQQSEAEFSDAMDRIKRALAGPTAGAAVFVADIVEGAQRSANVSSGGSTLSETRAQLGGTYAGLPAQNALGGQNAQRQAIEEYLAVAEKFDAAMSKNGASAAGFQAQLNGLGQALYAQSGLTTDQYNQLNELARRLQLVAEGNDAYSRTMGKVTQAGVEQNTELLAIARAMASYEEMLISGQITMPQYITGLERLAEHLGIVATAAGFAAGAIDAVNAATSAKPGGSVTTLGAWVRGQEVQAAGRGRELLDTVKNTSRGGRQSINPLTGQPNVSGPGGSSRAGDAMDNFGAAVGKFQEQEAAKASRAWSGAADKTAKAFAQAAEDAAGAFEDALGKVPGLFGTSDVTAQDMADAAAGVYQPKADEYLRQLRDEVLNGKDYAGVDLADIAGVAGVDQGLSKEAQLRQIEGMWNDSSLFANPDALRFINRDAIQAQQDRDAASAAGKANIYAMLGLGPDSPLTPDQQAAYAQMTGLDTTDPLGNITQQRRILTGANGQAMALTIGGGQPRTPEELQAATAAPEQTPQQAVAAALAKPENTGGGGKAFLDELLAGLTPEQIGGETAKTLQALGTSIFGAIFTGYESAAGEADWSEAVVAGLVDEVLPGVLTALEGNL